MENKKKVAILLACGIIVGRLTAAAAGNGKSVLDGLLTQSPYETGAVVVETPYESPVITEFEKFVEETISPTEKPTETKEQPSESSSISEGDAIETSEPSVAPTVEPTESPAVENTPEIIATTPPTTSPSTPEPTPELSLVDKILVDTKGLGTSGRLYFDSMYSVALYGADIYAGSAQSIVDAKDSAAIFRLGLSTVIADHKHQGFDIIKKVNVGDSAFIKYDGDVIEEYICAEVCLGTNGGSNMITSDGRDIAEMDDYDLVMYTCNQDWEHITIVFWKKAQPEMKLTLEN